jgi:hypothetical protein
VEEFVSINQVGLGFPAACLVRDGVGLTRRFTGTDDGLLDGKTLCKVRDSSFEIQRIYQRHQNFGLSLWQSLASPAQIAT